MTEPSDTIPVESLDQFVMILTAWHSEKCQVVQHLLTIPEGSEFEVGNDGEEKTTIILTGDSMAAFKLGIEMAMMQMGELPFVAEMEDGPAANDAQG